jgi:fibronectin-binding autotransporter adhesin
MKSSRSIFLLHGYLSLLCLTRVDAASGDWITNGNGNWSSAASWSTNPMIPGTLAGDTINLTNNITSNRSITVNTTSRTMGVLNIGDLNNTHRFTLQSTGGASVIFNNNGLGAALNETGTIADVISAPILLEDNLNVSAAGSLTMSGIISQSGTTARTLTKSGAGLLILSGNNSFSGGVNLAAGQLRVGDHANVFGAGIVTIQTGTIISSLNSNQTSVTGNNHIWNGAFQLTRGSGTTATWTFNGGATLGADTTITHPSSAVHTILNGVISDGAATRSLSLSPGSTGSVTLAGANAYDGGTILQSGRLNIKNATALGTGMFTFGIAGATIDNTSGAALTLTNNNPLSVRSFTFLGSNELNLGAGNMTLNSTSQFTVNASKLVFEGDVQAAVHGVEKRGSGTFSITGVNSAYTGTTTITAGVLEVHKMSNGGVNSSIGAASSAAGSLRFGSATGVLRYLGTVDAITNRSFTLSSGVGGGATIESSGVGTLSMTSGTIAYGTTNQTRVLTLGGSNIGNNSFARTITNNGSGATTLVKEGASRWVIGATNNTFTGPTIVNAGSLFINGNLAAGSAVTVASGATLGGSGTIGGATTFQAGASHSPGNGIGMQTFQGNLSYSSGSAFRWEIQSSPLSYDKVRIGGALSGSGATFHISSTSAYSDPYWSSNRTWSDVFTNTGGSPISYSAVFSSISGANLTWNGMKAEASSGGSFMISGSDLTWTAVPEVSNLWTVGLLSLSVFRRRK